MTAQTPAVRASGLRRSFRKKRALSAVLRRPFSRAPRIDALQGVDLEVRQGELFGLLGPNGAGKTTLLKILCGLVLPEKGHAEVLGIDVGREHELKPQIGLVHGDERSFYWRLTGRENLHFFGRLQGLGGRRLRDRVGALLERVEMAGEADRRLGDYSSGMKQRVAIARALLRDPPVLFMDEPTRALDPVYAARIRGFIRNQLLGKDGRTVILATHNLREAEQICDRVAILADGRVRQVAAPAELRRWGLSGRRYRLQVRGFENGPPAGLTEEAESEREDAAGRWYQASIEEPDTLHDLLERVRLAGGRLLECTLREQDLEEAFGRIIRSEEDGR